MVVVVVVLPAVATAVVVADMEVEVAAEVATETPAAKVLGGKHIIIALRMFGPFFSS